jgi:hypothetical protein
MHVERFHRKTSFQPISIPECAINKKRHSQPVDLDLPCMKNIDSILENPSLFRQKIQHALSTQQIRYESLPGNPHNTSKPSSVLFLMGDHCGEGNPDGPCLILTKRSEKVRQPGDLCCPGGGVSLRRDALLAHLLNIPGSPMARWPYWQRFRHQFPREASGLGLFFAAGLRECYEEMRINPLRVTFLGPLPTQELAMFHRQIYPMACWIDGQKRFSPNWEVEKPIHIPLKDLLNPNKYVRYRLRSETPRPQWDDAVVRDFPCFQHETCDGVEHLWGATFRITITFLELVFGFSPPDIDTLPVVHGLLNRNYLAGSP